MRLWRFLTLAAPASLFTFALAVAHGQIVNQIKVQPDKAPDASSLKSIVDSITRDCKTNDQKAIAIYNYCMLTNYHRAYPTEPGGIPVLKEINSYGWSLCGGLHTVESALWIEAGFEHRYVGWDGHTTVEAKYDGRWHYLDVFLHFYAWEPDGKGSWTIASEDDLTDHADQLLKKGFVLDEGRGCVYAVNNRFAMRGEHSNWQAPAFLSCGDTIDGMIAGLKTHKAVGPQSGWEAINHATGSYSTDVNLAPGFSLTNRWDPTADDWFWANSTIAPGHTCSGFKDTRNDPAYGLVLEPYVNAQKARSYANGTIEFSPDFSNGAFLKSFASTQNVKYESKTLVPADAAKPAAVVVQFSSPYIISGISSGFADEADLIEVSTDGGKTFAPTTPEKIGLAAKGKLEAMVRITFSKALKKLNLSVDVMNNPGALPYLSPGSNKITVTAADAAALGDNKLVVTYAYRLGSRNKSFDQLCEEDKEIAKQQGASWSDTITYAQKTFSGKELPATFDIDCPTPVGKYPVYPRMLFLRREVISGTSSPLALQAGVVAATSGAPAELQTLPNPFLIGAYPPSAATALPVNATKTIQIPLEYVEFCTEKGEVSEAGALVWPKNAGEKGKVIEGAVIYTGDLKNLPPRREIAAARIVFPVISGHNKAAEKVGAAFLATPVEKGKPADFKSLDAVVGTIVVPVQPENDPQYRPAKTFAIDVTRSVKSLAAHESTFSGIALRIVPDRGIDDGWTVRCQISPSEKAWLEIETTSK